MSHLPRTAIFSALALVSVLWSCANHQNAASQGATVPYSETAQTAREIWEKAIAAKGGREQLLEVKNLLISSKATKKYPRRGYEGLGTREESLIVYPDKGWVWRDDRPSKFGLVVEMCRGARCWKASDAYPRPSEVWEGEQGAVISHLQYFMETLWVKPQPKESRRDSFGREKVYAVVATWDRYEAEYLLNAESFLPRRLIVRGPASDGRMIPYVRVTMGEYASFGGIQMPTRQGWNLGLGVDGVNPRIVFSYQINVDYDPQIFEHPPSIEAGPEAWRPKNKN